MEPNFTESTISARDPSRNLTLNLDLAMHRFFTFTLDFRKKYSNDLCHVLAEHGIYFDDGRLGCNFCDFSVSRDEYPEFLPRETTGAKEKVRERHEERGCCIGEADSKNVPMGRVDSRVLDFKFEAHRLYSLLQKLDWQHVSPYDLAKSGFYYTGEEDNVRCVFCILEVRGWEAGDTPDGEHRRWNADCAFMSGKANASNVEIGREQDRRHRGPGSINPFAASAGRFGKFGPNLRFVTREKIYSITAHDLNVHDWSKAFHPAYATVSSRVDSFKDFWPKSLRQTPQELALAGFLYLGESDRAVCFQCNLALKDWAPSDDPWELHCKWNKKCQYLLMCTDPRFAWHAENASAGSMRCRECDQSIVSKVNLPCGHMTFCSSCSAQRCPACADEIVAEVQVAGFSFGEAARLRKNPRQSH